MGQGGYCDTSVLVALLASEPATPRVKRWFAELEAPLFSADWSVAEFHSAVAIKVRSGQLSAAQAAQTLELFEQLGAGGLHWVAVSRNAFRAAASLVDDHRSNLRGGDALHLAVAAERGLKRFATLDAHQGANAERLGLVLEQDLA